MTPTKLPECFLFTYLFLVLYIHLSSCTRDSNNVSSCPSSFGSCSADGPEVQFPFQLNDSHSQPDSCMYPGFELFCHGNYTSLEHTSLQELAVEKIWYETQLFSVYDPNQCLARKLLHLDLRTSLFELLNETFYVNKIYNLLYRFEKVPYVIYNCSTEVPYTGEGFEKIQCLSNLPGHYYFVPSTMSVEELALFSCLSIQNDLVLLQPRRLDEDYRLVLKWTKPYCKDCFGSCMRNLTTNETVCIYSQSTDGSPDLSYDHKGLDMKKIIAGSCVAVFLVVVLIITLLIYKAYIERKKKEQDAAIENFLKEYKSLTPTRYPYNDIKKMTENFKNKLGEGGYGNVYKGKFQSGLHVAVKVIENPTVAGEEFINEVSTIGMIHHVNLVRLLGFCVEGPNRALIYEFMPNHSLDKYIFSEDDSSMTLSWQKVNEIALGIARGIEYLHQGCSHRILHLDIKPQNILLDQAFTPKLSDFGLAKLCSKEKSVVSMTAARGTIGYIAPEIFLGNSKTVSHKSDVYSFGMLLLEMVGGQKNIKDEFPDTNQVYFPEWIYHQIQKGEELRLRISSEEDNEIAKKLTTVALWCIQWKPADRPSIKVAVQMLEGSMESLPVPPDPFISYIGDEVSNESVDADENS